MSKIYRNGEIYLYGDVGDLWFEESFTALDVVEALALHGADNPIKVHVNSGGGIATEGAAIYSILSSHKADVAIEIDGVAASAASIIAMAGDTITLRLGSVMMVHDPVGYFMGYTEDDLEGAKDQLNAIATTMSQIYADQTGQSAETCRTDMKSTLWLTPEDAVAKGYATTAGNENAIAAAAFDYRIYAKAPEQLVALAADKNWKFNSFPKQAVPSAANLPNDNGDNMSKELQARVDELTASVATLTADSKAKDQKIEAFENEKSDAERVAAVMALPEAEKRQNLATALAAQGMTVESAKVALAASPEVAAEKTPETTATTEYAAGRIAASGQATPNGNQPKQTAKIEPSSIYANRRNLATA